MKTITLTPHEKTFFYVSDDNVNILTFVHRSLTTISTYKNVFKIQLYIQSSETPKIGSFMMEI